MTPEPFDLDLTITGNHGEDAFEGSLECPHCSDWISDTDWECPSCGEPIESPPDYLDDVHLARHGGDAGP